MAAFTELSAPLTGSFPADHELSFERGELELLKSKGYARIGVGIAILNRAGQLLMVRNKGNYKINDGVWSITSETTAGRVSSSEPVFVEPIGLSVARCLQEEIGVNPRVAGFTTRSRESFATSDWPVGNRAELGKLFGINVALLADADTAERAVSMQETAEAYEARFMPIPEVAAIPASELRPGTFDCLRSLGKIGLLCPDALQTPIDFGDFADLAPYYQVENTRDIDLTRMA